MKIPGSNSNSDVTNASVSARLEQQRAKQTAANQEAAASSGLVAELNAQASSDRTTISSLASAIKQELNADAMREERAAKIAALKQAIKSGTYNPSSQAVAAKTAEEITFEVMFGMDALAQAE